MSKEFKYDISYEDFYRSSFGMITNEVKMTITCGIDLHKKENEVTRYDRHRKTKTAEINGSNVQIYSKPPPALEFLRESVHPNRPALIKGAFNHWPARTQWTNDHLCSKMGDATFTVATTPNGYADAVTHDTLTRKEYFAMPYKARMSFNAFLDITEGRTVTENAHYVSLQNGSLSVEYGSLEQDVDQSIEWCSEALGKSPDAVNFWFDDYKSITSLHKDPYENCYAAIREQKTLIFYPPTEYYCMHETMYQNAIFEPHPTTDQLELKPLESKTPWIPVDPLNPDYNRFPRLSHARPVIVTVEEEGVIVINYWYDMDYQGNRELLDDVNDESDG
ncbi:jmjC domain-containing protein 7 [Choanephora cucurbitarum]|nr:jmjC domain-containing protein 7 [Choanephora cucurbitarum]